MPRRIVPFSNSYPIHINARAINKEPFNAPVNLVWQTMENYLSLVSRMYLLKIYSFVLMPNHFHLIVKPTQDNLGVALNYFMRETSKEIGRLTGRINQVYGGRAYKTVITSERHFLIAYKYVYRNPVKANLCRNVEDFPFSTLSFLTGRIKSVLPLEEDTQLFCPDFSQKTIDWLNTKPLERHENEVRLALRRRVFELQINNNTKKSSNLEIELF